MRKRNFILFVILNLFVLIVTASSCGASNNATGGTNSDMNEGMYAPGYNGGSNVEDSFIGDINNEEYNKVTENPFYNTTYQQSSFFSMDSFTASYSNLRRYINSNMALNGDIIKTDELINYFSYDLEKPAGDDVFKVSAEMSTAPWNTSHKVLTIGVTTKEDTLDSSNGNNIVFLIDVSGSMNSSNKIGLLKQAFSMLLDTLSPTDRISIITYASGVKTVCQGVYADNKEQLKSAINNLKASGGTNGSGGIQSAYNVARQYFIPEGNNRIILATDGDFNIGISDKDELKEFIAEKAQNGIYLTCLGFGMGNYKDTTMEALAKNGNGGYAYIDSLQEAKKVLVDEINTTLVTVAKDVKNKVEFNPNIVESYRLIGYENKLLSEDQFNDETVDAGEVGSGHTTLVTYEIVLKDNASLEEAFNVQINYKDPKSNVSTSVKEGFTLAELANQTSEDHKFALCVVEFSLVLRNSKYRGTASYQSLISRLYSLECIKTDEAKKEFVSLVELAYSKNLLAAPNYDDSQVTITICTEYGFNQALCKTGTFVSNEVILNLIFNNKIPSGKRYEIALDEDFTRMYIGTNITSNLTVYVREVYQG